MPAARPDLVQRVAARLAEARRAAGVTQESLAGRLEISTKNVQRFESGRQNLTLRTVEKIAKALRVVPESLLGPRSAAAVSVEEPFARLESAGFKVTPATDGGRRSKHAVPIVDLRAAAGPFRSASAVATVGWLISAKYVPGDAMTFVAQIFGESMTPTVASGAFVLFRRTTRRPTPGRLYLFELAIAEANELGGPYVLKRFGAAKTLSNGKLRVTLKSDNRSHPNVTVVLDDVSELRIIAELVEVLA